MVFLTTGLLIKYNSWRSNGKYDVLLHISITCTCRIDILTHETSANIKEFLNERQVIKRTPAEGKGALTNKLMTLDRNIKMRCISRTFKVR